MFSALDTNAVVFVEAVVQPTIAREWASKTNATYVHPVQVET
jgi:hypothetical protein